MKHLLISQVDPLHPVAHVQTNSLTCDVDGNNAEGTLTLLLNKMLFDSLVGRMLTGFPIELIPRIPRRTTTAVVCSRCVFSFSLLIGFYKITHKQTKRRQKFRTELINKRKSKSFHFACLRNNCDALK